MSEQDKKYAQTETAESTTDVSLFESIDKSDIEHAISGNETANEVTVSINLSESTNNENVTRMKFIKDMILSEHFQTASDVIKKWNCQNELLPSGKTLLQLCQDIGSIEGTKMLLEIGADPTIANKGDASPCYYAVRNDKPDLMKLYLTHLKKERLEYLKNKSIYNHGTLLHNAVWYSEPKMIRLLLSFGFSPNKQNYDGETPLFLLDNRHEKAAALAFFNTPNAIKPDLSIRDNTGRTAEEQTTCREIRQILHNERRKEILTRRKMDYNERRLIYLKKQAHLRIKKQKKMRLELRARGGLENV